MLRRTALGEADHTQTDIAEDVAGLVTGAVGRAAVPGAAAPGAAAQQPPSRFVIFINISPLDIRAHPGAAILRCSLIPGVPLIQAPLPHIAMHIPQTPSISWEIFDNRSTSWQRTHRCGLPPILAIWAITISTITIVLSKLRANRFPKVKRCDTARPAGVFPLGFAG